MRRIKTFFLIFIPCLLMAISLLHEPVIKVARAYATGPPPGMTGAPGESSCLECHIGAEGPGSFTIGAPQTYAPGQTYLITVTHTSSQSSRRRWGFEMTALSGSDAAGTFQNLTGQTQTISEFGRFYIEHTSSGTFASQPGGAQWSFNWTAPSNDVGTITFYAAGNQANNDGTSSGDQIYFAIATSEFGVAASPTPTPTPTPSPSPSPSISPTPTPTPTPTPPPFATIDGRVFNTLGGGLRGARVTLADNAGNSRTAITSSLGFFTFSDVPTNVLYHISVQSKRYRFEAKDILINGNQSNVDFFGLE